MSVQDLETSASKEGTRTIRVRSCNQTPKEPLRSPYSAWSRTTCPVYGELVDASLLKGGHSSQASYTMTTRLTSPQLSPSLRA